MVARGPGSPTWTGLPGLGRGPDLPDRLRLDRPQPAHSVVAGVRYGGFASTSRSSMNRMLLKSLAAKRTQILFGPRGRRRPRRNRVLSKIALPPSRVLAGKSCARAWLAVAVFYCAKRAGKVGVRVGHVNAEWMATRSRVLRRTRGETVCRTGRRLLDNMLASIGMSREGQTLQSVYIANVLEVQAARQSQSAAGRGLRAELLLLRQIEPGNPALIVVMGRFGQRNRCSALEASIASLRGKAHQINVAGRSDPGDRHYHPAYLLRNLVDKAKELGRSRFGARHRQRKSGE